MPLKPREVIDFDDPRVAKIGHPAPPWLVNWADLTTELAAFFVLMYALSASLSPTVQAAKEEVEKVVEEVRQEGGEVKTEMTREGLRISLIESGGAPFFPSGSAALTPQIQAALDKLAPALKEALAKGKGEILVEGHTDNRPIQTRFYPSNWELSTARATNVVQYLVRRHGLPPPRISAIGYGEFRPVAPNDTPENMAKNRRVVLFVKATESGRSEKEREEAGK